MNTNHQRMGTGIASLITAGLMILTPVHAEASNRRPKPDVVCPAIDLVPECLAPAGSASSPDDGSPQLPQTLPVAGGGGGGSALLSHGRIAASPQ